MTLASWERRLSVDLTRAFLGVKALLPDVRERRSARADRGKARAPGAR
ncbi:predicted protein [Streptomyces sp. SPB78]|nr:predicted protein [Streptomyces sp. SPB78]